jgi:hypothetical protein
LLFDIFAELYFNLFWWKRVARSFLEFGWKDYRIDLGYYDYDAKRCLAEGEGLDYILRPG